MTMTADPLPVPIQIASSPMATFDCIELGPGVVALRGELDADNAPALTQALLALYCTDHPTITVNLSQVTFVGAAGLTVLLYIFNLCNIDGREMILRHPSAAVRRILKVTGLDKILLIDLEVE